MDNLISVLNYLNNNKDIDFSNVLDYLNTENINLFELNKLCLELLVQQNFTGPVNEALDEEIKVNAQVVSKVREDLTCEGEAPFVKCRGLVLLWLSKIICEHLRRSVDPAEVYSGCMELLKALYIQQEALREEMSPSLRDEVSDCLQQARKQKMEDEDGVISAAAEFQVELMAGHFHCLYYEYALAAEAVNKVLRLAGIRSELRGALGKRTKFQQDAYTQLYLHVERIGEGEEEASTVSAVLDMQSEARTQVPNDLMADDELLLETVQFQETETCDTQRARLSVVEQAAVVLQATVHLASRARDETTLDETAAMISRALGSSHGRLSSWGLVTDALMLRTRLSVTSTRRSERQLMQLEELTTQLHKPFPVARERGRLFFLGRAPAAWSGQLRLANMYLGLGLTKSALDALLPWDQWTAIIDCYTRLGHKETARALIETQLREHGNTPELLCCLGDVSLDPNCYERAWTLSKQRSARAMRCLGRHHLNRDNLEDAVVAFECSLSANPMQSSVWFSYGICALRLLDFKKAVTAFKRVTMQEPDNFEAWNNCASAYVEMGEKKSALRLLQEAAKCRYDNWQVWSNILVVAAEAAQSDTAVKAYNRLLDLLPQHRDHGSLDLIISCHLATAAGPANCQALSKLLARIERQDGRDPMLWLASARFYEADLNTDKALYCYSQAYWCFRATGGNSGWIRAGHSRRNVLQAAHKLASRSLQLRAEGPHDKARLVLSSALSAVQNLAENEISELEDGTKKLLESLKELEKQIGTDQKS